MLCDPKCLAQCLMVLTSECFTRLNEAYQAVTLLLGGSVSQNGDELIISENPSDSDGCDSVLFAWGTGADGHSCLKRNTLLGKEFLRPNPVMI